MALTIDYYFAPNSPWTYLGHERFAQIARAAGAGINVLPVDLGGDRHAEDPYEHRQQDEA